MPKISAKLTGSPPTGAPKRGEVG